MKIQNVKTFNFLLIAIFLVFTQANSENKKTPNSHQLNLYLGVLDFSKEKQKAGLIGIQHQNENLQRDTFLGNLSPITGGFVTENSAIYVYSGVEWNFDLGAINFTPSFAPGLYEAGDGKDLGHVLEFKSEVQASFNFSENTSFGMSYNHISNASLGDKNPGANSYEINFLKKF